LTSAIDVALAVLVDHELTASTVAARAAAGVGTDPWMVLLAGLSAMSGRFQAGASHAAVAMLRAWSSTHRVNHDWLPGFGHKVYTGADPRAALLLEQVAELSPEIVAVADDLAVEVAREYSLYPNIDLALAALTLAADLPDYAGEIIFTLARIAGLMAHAIEEYPHGLRFRPRAVS